MRGEIWVNFGSANGIPKQHQAIIWTNVGSTLKVFCGINLGALSHEVLINLTHEGFSENTHLELLPHLRGSMS